MAHRPWQAGRGWRAMRTLLVVVQRPDAQIGADRARDDAVAVARAVAQRGRLVDAARHSQRAPREHIVIRFPTVESTAHVTSILSTTALGARPGKRASAAWYTAGVHRPDQTAPRHAAPPRRDASSSNPPVASRVRRCAAMSPTAKMAPPASMFGIGLPRWSIGSRASTHGSRSKRRHGGGNRGH